MTVLRRRRVIRSVVPLVLAAWLTGCTGIRTFDPTAPTFADQAPRKGELFLRDGTSLMATEIFVVGDSVFAYGLGRARSGREPPIRLARSDVASVEERYDKQPESTLLGLVGAAAVAYGVYRLVTWDLCYWDCP